MKKKSPKKILPITLILIIAVIIVTVVINNMQKDEIIMTPRMSRLQAYEDVKENDELVYDENNDLITGVQFDAFFLEDKNGDGYAEEVRGSCNEVGTDANFYMDLKVIENGYLKDGTITINSENFYFNTAIVKDNVIADNYISTNTKTIKLNELTNGSQALLIGSVRSGDYSSSSSKTSAIGNDTTKYSKENTITFTGTYVEGDKEYKFTKTIPFMVDWYGEVNAEITPKAQTLRTSDFNNLVTEAGLTLDFNVKVTENRNQLNLYGSYIKGTIPEFNGYKPTQVTISGTNVTYEYNAETGEFTAQREAIVNENGVITSNAYTSTTTSSSTVTRNNIFDFKIIYPVEAFQTMGEDISSLELAIPIEAVNKGYNNPNTEDGFENPFVSNTATGIVTTTWKLPVEYTYNPYFSIYVGDYMGGRPYYGYVVSKEKPINIYNGISSEEKDDIYEVEWRAYTGTNGITDGIIMNEAEGKTDSFMDTSSQYISMEELTTNRGIYFGGATNTLGQEGWIKVYDAETGALIETFTSSNWSSYTSSNPYLYENKVKHIRVETSGTNEESTFYVYNIKELDDEYITENYTREEFDNLVYIYSYLDGYMLAKTEEPNNEETTEVSYWYKATASNNALYATPTSVANITIKESTISAQATAENQIITITTETDGYNEQKWKNGTFLVKIPKDIIYAEINEVTTNNQNVKILAYDLYEEGENYFIKILTENENEATYNIKIDLDMTPDPRMPKTTENVELYAINETACDYYYGAQDQYNIDGDANIQEEVNYRTTSLTMDPGTSLNTTQIGTNYGDGDNITIAPKVIKTDKTQRTATIQLMATNNYSFPIEDIKIQGVIPFEGNQYVLTERDLGSTFTTNIINGGIKILTEGIQDYVTVYYSTSEHPTNDINEPANGWKTAEEIEDWNTIKTYIIAIDNKYQLTTGETIEFEYDISLPQGVDYNEVTYSEHAIYFSLVTSDGKYATSTGSEKLGFMIAKQYDLEIIKYQEDTEKKLPRVTFSLTEDGQETSSIKVTDTNGTIKFIGLFAGRYYTLKEERTTEDYVLNGEEIRFYTNTEINSDGTESLYLQYVDANNQKQEKDIYESVREDEVIAPKPEEGQDYKIQIKIENEVKAKLSIHKKDSSTGEPLKNVKFTLTGEGKNKILTTDKEGNILVSGLYLDKEYILTETKSTGYYLAQEPIKFTITNDNGTIKFLNYTDNNNITESNTIEINDEIPTVKLELQNDKIPTYGLQLTKYAKGEKVENPEGEQVDKTLERAQYKIYGEGINEDEEIYTTDENGVLKIEGLYEYVEGRYITGEYRLVEIYAPEGYSLNSTELKFKAYRENGTLKIEILEGEDVIRVIETKDAEGNVTESKQDLNIADASGTNPVIQIGVEDNQIFTLYKYTTDGTTSKEIPIPGTKFVITDLEGNYVTGTDGQTIGEWVETTEESEITLSSTGNYKWTQRDDGTWESGNSYINNSTSTLTSNEFTLLQDATLEFEWSASSHSQYNDYLYYKITNIETGQIIGGTSTRIGGKSYGTNYQNLKFDKMSIKLNSGTYKIEFVYRKDYVNSYWLDAGFVKNIRLEPKPLKTSWVYAVTTDENGLIKANLPEGLYKAVEIYTDDKYVLEESEADRTYYFGIGASKAAKYDWANSLTGKGWENVNSIEATEDGGVVGVGSFTEYSSTVISGAEDGIDLNKDGIIDKVSQGSSDGIIAYYDVDGNYTWSKTFGGNADDALNKIIQTSDGGYAIVGYVTSGTVNYDGKEIPELARTDEKLGNKDAVLLKIDKDGNYEWGIRFGGTSDDEIKAVAETSQKQLVVVGNFYSETMNFYENNNGANTEVKEQSFENLNSKRNRYGYQSGMNGFIVAYSETGKYEWSQRIGGSYDIEVVDVTATVNGVAIAVNHINDVYLNTDNNVSQSGTYASDYLKEFTNGTVVEYNLDGTYSWRYRFHSIETSSYKHFNTEISSIKTDNENNLIVAIEYQDSTLRGSLNGNSTYTTIIDDGPTSDTYDASLIRLKSNGEYDKVLYTLKGNLDDYISDAVPTSDGGYLLGGWYYSTKIDVDGDRLTTGVYDFKENSGKSEGFVIKVDQDGKVTYSSRLYGEGYEGVMSVAETKNGTLASGGYFNTSTLNATNYKFQTIDEETGEEITTGAILDNGKGNSNGFIISEGAYGNAVVPEAQNLKIKNDLKTFKITTEVIKHDENGVQVAGGDITGEAGTYEGVEYSKDGIRYVETVTYGENSTKEIIITPETGYVISYIKINGKEYTNFITNENGTVTIPIFENVTEDKHIIVEFSNTKSSVEVNHLLWTEEGITTQKVAESESYIGDVGEDYRTSPKTDIDYEIITNADYYGENLPEGVEPEDYYIPDNATGTYVSGEKPIVNYYYKEKVYTLTVHHYLVGTNQQLPLKGSTSGETVADEITENLKKGSSYETVKAPEDKIDYEIYELVETPENAKGTIEQNTEVTYYYQIKTANISFTKVAEEDHTQPLVGTEFALYKLNDKNAENKEELIDIKEPQECWTLVNTYTTPENGIITLLNLQITDEYRIVETKASEGRMVADGQWKIIFLYGEYEENDEIITVGETKFKMPAVGNPPAIAITEEGKLQIPNREYFDFPSSGSIGSKTIYQIGIVVIAIGLILLVSRRVIFIKGRNKKIKQQIQKNKHKGKH